MSEKNRRNKTWINEKKLNCKEKRSARKSCQIKIKIMFKLFYKKRWDEQRLSNSEYVNSVGQFYIPLGCSMMKNDRKQLLHGIRMEYMYKRCVGKSVACVPRVRYREWERRRKKPNKLSVEKALCHSILKIKFEFIVQRISSPHLNQYCLHLKRVIWNIRR